MIRQSHELVRPKSDTVHKPELARKSNRPRLRPPTQNSGEASAGGVYESPWRLSRAHTLVSGLALALPTASGAPCPDDKLDGGKGNGKVGPAGRSCFWSY